MTDILTLVFRTFMSQCDLKKELTVGPPPPAATSVLVVGDHDVSRSVLLLAAVTAASHLGIRVTFFTQTQIQSLPAAVQRCVPSLSPESLKSNGRQAQGPAASSPLSSQRWTMAKPEGSPLLPQIPSLISLIAIFKYAVLWMKMEDMELQQLGYSKCGTFTSLEEASQRHHVPKTVRTTIL